MIDTCHYTFVQTHGMYTTKVNLTVNCGPGMVMMCQGRYISCNTRTILVLNVLSEEGCGRQGGPEDYKRTLCAFGLIFL